MTETDDLSLPSDSSLERAGADSSFVEAYTDFARTLRVAGDGLAIVGDYNFFLFSSDFRPRELPRARLLAALLQPSPIQISKIVYSAIGLNDFFPGSGSLAGTVEAIEDFQYEHFPVRDFTPSFDDSLRIVNEFANAYQCLEYSFFAQTAGEICPRIDIHEEVDGMGMGQEQTITVRGWNSEWAIVTITESTIQLLPVVVGFVRVGSPVRGLILGLDEVAAGVGWESWWGRGATRDVSGTITDAERLIIDSEAIWNWVPERVNDLFALPDEQIEMLGAEPGGIDGCEDLFDQLYSEEKELAELLEYHRIPLKTGFTTVLRDRLEAIEAFERAEANRKLDAELAAVQEQSPEQIGSHRNMLSLGMLERAALAKWIGGKLENHRVRINANTHRSGDPRGRGRTVSVVKVSIEAPRENFDIQWVSPSKLPTVGELVDQVRRRAAESGKDW